MPVVYNQVNKKSCTNNPSWYNTLIFKGPMNSIPILAKSESWTLLIITQIISDYNFSHYTATGHYHFLFFGSDQMPRPLWAPPSTSRPLYRTYWAITNYHNHHQRFTLKDFNFSDAFWGLKLHAEEPWSPTLGIKEIMPKHVHHTKQQYIFFLFLCVSKPTSQYLKTIKAFMMHFCNNTRRFPNFVDM